MLMMGIHESQCVGLKPSSTSEAELLFEEAKKPIIRPMRPHISSSDSGPAKIANIIN